MRLLLVLTGLCLCTAASAAPFRDPIPAEFLGTFAPTAAGCRDPNGVELIEVMPDGIHYYEGDDFLILGISYSGTSTKSEKFVPLFNGRFTGRSETQLLGEVSAHMELETPNLLIRYSFKDDGEVDPKPVNTWVRCPSKPAKP